MPTPEEIERRLQVIWRGLIDRAKEKKLVEREMENLDEELRRELGNNEEGA